MTYREVIARALAIYDAAEAQAWDACREAEERAEKAREEALLAAREACYEAVNECFSASRLEERDGWRTCTTAAK